MSYNIQYTDIVMPHVEQAISAAKRKASRDGRVIGVFSQNGGKKYADVWPDGRVDLTFAGSGRVSIPSQRKLL